MMTKMEPAGQATQIALMMSWGRNSYPGLCNYNSHKIHVCFSLHLQKQPSFATRKWTRARPNSWGNPSMFSFPNGSLNLCILPNCMNIVYFCFIYMLYYRYFVIFQESNCSTSTIPIPFGDPCDFVIFVLHQSSIRHHQPQKGVKLWLIVINYLFFFGSLFPHGLMTPFNPLNPSWRVHSWDPPGGICLRAISWTFSWMKVDETTSCSLEDPDMDSPWIC